MLNQRLITYTEMVSSQSITVVLIIITVLLFYNVSMLFSVVHKLHHTRRLGGGNARKEPLIPHYIWTGKGAT